MSSPRDGYVFADKVYEAVCRDADEAPSKKGSQAFRDKVYDSCTATAVVLPASRVGPRAVATMGKLLRACALRRLDLTDNAVGDRGVAAVVQLVRAHPQTLRFLSLGGNSLGNDGGRELADLLNDRACPLWALELGGGTAAFRRNAIDEAVTPLAVALSTNRSLTALGLAGNPVGKAGQAAMVALTMMLGANHTLTSLDLESCELGRAAPQLCAALAQNRAVRHLNLAGNGSGPSIGEALAPVLAHNSTLVSLRLGGNGIGRGLLHFCEALRGNSSLCVLGLDDNDLGDEGAAALADVLVVNRTLVNLSVAGNGFSEKAGQALAVALGRNDVLSHLNISRNPIKGAAVAFADSLVENCSVISLDLSSCKISDDGAVALVSAVSIAGETSVLRKLRLRENFISSNSGELLVDALYRNKSITVADLRGNKLDHVRLQKIRAVCRRNLMAQRDAEPRRLRREIVRLKGEQAKLRKAEKTLRTYTATIEATRRQIGTLESEKAQFLATQQRRRADISEQIRREQEGIAAAQGKLDEKKRELESVANSYETRIEGLRESLAKETAERQTIEADLAAVKEELALATKDRPQKVQDLKSRIEAVRAEKLRHQRQLTAIRRELARLQAAYKDGTPILPLINAAHELLIKHQADPSLADLETIVQENMPEAARAPKSPPRSPAGGAADPAVRPSKKRGGSAAPAAPAAGATEQPATTLPAVAQQ